ncbi:MAG: carboxylating nicotinate-nucleotide diphosphorylase [Pirellulales bacterium]|nr:carboxylating nicotinate-nucleotide diphosphorylase [Pirellulales bacterium]
MPRDFDQLDWNDDCRDACRKLVRLAIVEDLGREYDWTTLALVPASSGAANIVSRQSGIVAGLLCVQVVLEEYNADMQLECFIQDGDAVQPGSVVATVSGDSRHLLTSERVFLNMLCRLSGIASLVRKFVDAVAETSAKIYDTRKTTPGWRLLEKYAVRCGGGCNHRQSLADAILIKDNHLAIGHSLATHSTDDQSDKDTPAQAVRRAREFLANIDQPYRREPRRMIEVEVDSLEQLRQVLPESPDIVLLDNMTPESLQEAVSIRNELNATVELEASGGVSLETVAAIAATGVERISAGALTHQATWLDFGLDWKTRG